MNRAIRQLALISIAIGFGASASTELWAQGIDYSTPPSPLVIQAAQAANLVYGLSENQDLRLVDSGNAKIGKLTANYPDGFKAAVYLDNSGRYYVAFAGTDASALSLKTVTKGLETAKDLSADAMFLGGQKSPTILGQGQLQEALNFAQIAKVALARMGAKPEDIVVTGHSLGGGLAQFVGSTVLPTSQIETFSAPGVGNIFDLVEADPSNPLRQIVLNRADSVRAVNHIRIDDPVAWRGGDHVGNVVVYDDPLSDPHYPLDLQAHSLSMFLSDLMGGLGGIRIYSADQLEELRRNHKELEAANPQRESRERSGYCGWVFSDPVIRGSQLDTSQMTRYVCDGPSSTGSLAPAAPLQPATTVADRINQFAQRAVNKYHLDFAVDSKKLPPFDPNFKGSANDTTGRECTDYVREALKAITGQSVPPEWTQGNAKDWLVAAPTERKYSSQGKAGDDAEALRNAPPGSVVVWNGYCSPTCYGHVGIVVSTSGEVVTISEANLDGKGSVTQDGRGPSQTGLSQPGWLFRPSPSGNHNLDLNFAGIIYPP